LHFGDRQTNRTDALSRSCCRERRLNNGPTSLVLLQANTKHSLHGPTFGCYYLSGPHHNTKHEANCNVASDIFMKVLFLCIVYTIPVT